jgi:hypothetical protein
MQLDTLLLILSIAYGTVGLVAAVLLLFESKKGGRV